MKKTATVLGVSAMVIMLGMGSGFAQTTQPSASGSMGETKQVVPVTPEKDKTKPPVEMKTTPVKPSDDKGTKASEAKPAVTAPEKGTGTSGSAVTKPEVTKPAVEGKGAAPAKDSSMKPEEKKAPAGVSGETKSTVTPSAPAPAAKTGDKAGESKAPAKP